MASTDQSNANQEAIQQQVSYLQNVASRVQNYTNTGVGNTTPYPIRSGNVLPVVSNIKLVKSGAILGQTKITLTWQEPDNIRQIAFYNVYTQGNVLGQTQQTLVASAHTSPCVFNILTDLSATVQVFIQTVLKNGQSLPLDECPTVSFISNNPANVGIGTTTPASSLTVVSPSGAGVLGVIDEHLSADAGSSQYLFFHNRSATTTPTALLSADGLGAIAFAGSDGTQNVNTPAAAVAVGFGAQISAITTENWTTSAHGAKIRFKTVPNGGTSNQIALTLDQNGNTIIGFLPQFAGTNTTGAGSAALGANSPAVTNTAPYQWIKALSADGSTVYFPVWK